MSIFIEFFVLTLICFFGIMNGKNILVACISNYTDTNNRVDYLQKKIILDLILVSVCLLYQFQLI